MRGEIHRNIKVGEHWSQVSITEKVKHLTIRELEETEEAEGQEVEGLADIEGAAQAEGWAKKEAEDRAGRQIFWPGSSWKAQTRCEAIGQTVTCYKDYKDRVW